MMKKLTFFVLSLMCSGFALAQTTTSSVETPQQVSSGPLQSYTAIDGHTYHLGDTVQLGQPSMKNTKTGVMEFNSVYLSAGGTTPLAFYQKADASKKIAIKFFRSISRTNQRGALRPFKAIVFQSSSGAINAIIEIDEALKLGELKSANPRFNYKTYNASLETK